MAHVNSIRGVCLIEDSDGSCGPSGELAFPPTGCEICVHARGCEQLLLSSIFHFRCLALSSSVFLASNCEKCSGR